MEEESFSDPEVAARMNETFVCIKVDREEHPDLDNIYMAVCQKMTGSGGWPMTIIMTPEKKPFFAGTYFPREGRAGRIGMLQLIAKIEELWTNRKNKAKAAAEEIMTNLHVSLEPESGGRPQKGLVEEVFTQLSGHYDNRYGGFGSAPKFPVPINHLFLLRYWLRTGDQKALDMTRQTLRAMRLGGIYDHLGYGIHRYATDDRWFAPHFEKMLYDQALVAMACTETYCATGEDEFRDMAREILFYALHNLKSPKGAFYSAEDADSEGEEGRFYTWTAGEIDKVLNPVERSVAKMVFNITEERNRANGKGQDSGRNVLHLRMPLSGLSPELGLTPGRLQDVFDSVREKMLAARMKRPRPFKDTKIMTDWNGLMIAALASAAGAFDEVVFADAAEKALSHILESMRENDGQLFHIRYDKETVVPANLDDYAYLLWGIVELYQATFRVKHLTGAISIADEMLRLFWDDARGGLFFSPRGSGPLPIRHKFASDGALPSGNAVAAMNLLRIGRLTARPVYEEKVAAIGRIFARSMERHPVAYTHLISVFNMALNHGAEVIIIGNPEMEDTLQMISTLRCAYAPNTVAAFIPSTLKKHRILELIPYARDVRTLEGKATAYVCKNFLCMAPTTDLEVMISSVMDVEKGRT